MTDKYPVCQNPRSQPPRDNFRTRSDVVEKKTLTSGQRNDSSFKPAVVLAVTVFSRRALRFQVVLGSKRPHRAELRGTLDRA